MDIMTGTIGTPRKEFRDGTPRKAFRDPDDRLLSGVAAGVAEHLGLEPLHVRLGFVALALVGGLGVVIYGALWVLLPVRGDGAEAPGIEAATRLGLRTKHGSGSSRDLSVAVSLCLVGVGGIVLLQNAGLWINSRVFWPLLVAGIGIGLLWWQSDESARSSWLSVGGWKAWLRIAVGVALVAGAVWLTLFQAGVQGALDDAVGAILLAVVGVALVIGPWVVRLTRDLRTERRERIRSQERADVAAHLHDSVLQTLALIQRQAADPSAISQLARTQERELRSWLFDNTDPEASTLKAALQRVVTEVEAAHQVPIELVIVGDDIAADDAIAALVAASREAMVNAAKHSGADRVDVYAEVGPSQVEVDVRDRGAGFDLDGVDTDRQGVRGSILDRMTRHGGRAEIRTDVGHGTEIRMWVPRADTDNKSSTTQGVPR
jgi:signal transduction histidine kinase/phage shock protein PspC (stress-responsive transcriptional regulator)